MLLNKVWNMSYDEYVQVLLKKYGPATSNYFINGRISASRTKDGLECHHIDEDKIAGLSNRHSEKQYPEYQKDDRLVYCNRIEHLILHSKIAKLNNENDDLFGYFKGGPKLLITKLNDNYMEQSTKKDWNTIVSANVEERFPLYIEVLKRIAADMKELGYSRAQTYELIFSTNKGFPKLIIDYYVTHKIDKNMTIKCGKEKT